MRSRILVCVLALLLMLSTAVFADAVNSTFHDFPVVKVVVNGVTLQPSVPGVNFFGSTLVPARAIAEALGGRVSWDAVTWTASIDAANTTELQNKVTELQGQVDQLKADKTKLEADNATLQKQISDLRNPPPPAPAIRGTSRSNPAKIGDVFTVTDSDYRTGAIRYEIEMKEIVSGDAAWQAVRLGNQFNDSPPAGKEYILAKFRVKVLSTEKDDYFHFNMAQFDTVSSAGVTYGGFLSVSGLDPSFGVDLYRGAEHLGWAYFLVDKTDHPLAVFERSTNGGLWFDLRP